METEKIIEIIEANPKLSYEKMQKQAQNIGLDLKLFDATWNKAKKKSHRKKGY